ncbi:amino acid adenylation domain-containing protein [Streptomyces sp. NPDC055794]
MFGELSPGTTAGPGRNDRLLAAFATLLFRFTGQELITVDRIEDVEGADRVGVAHAVVRGGDTMDDVARTIRHTARSVPGAFGIRFADAGEAARPRDTLGEQHPGEIPGELWLIVQPGACGRSRLELRYDAGLFDASTASRLLAHFRTLVVDAAENPGQSVARLRVLSEAQQRRVLVEWNATAADLPHYVTLHEAFEEQAARSPDAVAVVYGSQRWTYARVDSEANRLARHLRSLGVGPDVRVGLCLNRSPELLVAVLGILKAGGAYVPLDPDYPAQRIAAMVDGTSCAVTVSREDVSRNLPVQRADAQLVLLDRDADALAAWPGHALDAGSGPEHLCYVIHTSGSTGVPKPIALRHRGVLNNLADLNSRFAVGPGDSVLALSSPSFDMSVYEFLGMTLAGGTVVVPEPERAKDPVHWAELLTEHRITVWNSAPALLGLLADHLEASAARRLPRLRLAMLGGDWVPLPLPGRARAFAPGLRVIVMGGATEASIHSTIFEVDTVDPSWPSIPYGRPMANQRTYILDEYMQPVPPGVAGELFLAGTGLARGYLDQPERTAERFVDWSCGEVRDRLYRTGDLARFGADGLIELLGRIDFQVKVNGLRVELGEIEATLRGHSGVRQVAVVAREGRLVAYVVPDTDDAQDAADLVGALRSLAADRLPAYMVPRAFVPLTELPLTPNGKVDRAHLPDPVFAGAAYRAPRTARERVVASVFAHVLGAERVGADDDFLALGGDSVRAIQVVIRARAAGVEVSARQVLELRTVGALAAAAADSGPVRGEAGEPVPAQGPLVAVDHGDMEAWTRRYGRVRDVWPLTPMQSGMIFETMLGDTGNDTYLMQTVHHLTGAVDTERLRVAYRALLDRHDALRVVFVSDSADNLVQVVVDEVALPWREIDLRDLPAQERPLALRRFLAEDRSERFALDAAPLLRAALVRMGDEQAELIVTAHHALIDGWSEQVLADELAALYASRGEVSALGPVPEFRDFLAWSARRDTAASTRVWAHALAGLDGPTLVTPPGRQLEAGAGKGDITVPLSPDDTELLRRRCAAMGVTVNSLMQGAWGVVLGALTGSTDVVFGATVSGRPDALAGVESTVGLFINTIPVRVRWTHGDTVEDLMTDLRDRQNGLLDHHHDGLTEIHRATGVDSLFDTLLVFQSYPVASGAADGADGFSVSGVDSLGTVNYPLALFVDPDRVTLQYHPGLYDAAAAQSLMDRFRAVLHRMARSPARPVHTIDLLTPGERDRLVETAVAAPVDSVVAQFRHRARTTPDAVAVTGRALSLTYGEVDAQADALARMLAEENRAADSLIALDVPCPARLAVALLGVLTSGAVYAHAGATPGPVSRTITSADVEKAACSIAEHPDSAPATGPVLPDALHPRALACLREDASGAPGHTGVDHRTLALEVSSCAAETGLRPGSRLRAASGGADTTAFALLVGLCAGASVEVVDDPVSSPAPADLLCTTAPVLAALLPNASRGVGAGTVLLADAAPTGHLVRRLRGALPRTRIVSRHTGRRRILGAALELLPSGTTGQVYVTDAAGGHAGAAAPTARRFVADPYGRPGARMYATGESGHWSESGELVCTGRIDAVTRVRGRLVRLDDVEAVLAEHPEVTQAVVVAHEDAGGDGRLSGYVVGAAGRFDAGAGVREFAARRLPDAMVPDTLTVLDRMPLTPDGLVDRAALPRPDEDGAGAAFREGRTAQEKELCALFADIIGVEQVGIDDNFLSLGVNSLTAGKIVGRMHRTMGVKSSIRALFRNPTIAQLAEQLEAPTARRRPALRRASSDSRA